MLERLLVRAACRGSRVSGGPVGGPVVQKVKRKGKSSPGSSGGSPKSNRSPTPVRPAEQAGPDNTRAAQPGPVRPGQPRNYFS